MQIKVNSLESEVNNILTTAVTKINVTLETLFNTIEILQGQLKEQIDKNRPLEEENKTLKEKVSQLQTDNDNLSTSLNQKQ